MNTKIYVPDVTMLAISSIYIQETIQALLYSMKGLEFASVKFLTHEKPDNLPKEIEFCKIPKINDIMDFNRFAFFDVGDYFDTSHSLWVQSHGFILNPFAWTNRWLDYSYIGAPWPIVENSYIANDGTRARVGNGGFSLRSRELCRIAKEKDLYLREEQGWKNEDGQYCCYWKKEMIEWGMKFPPVEVAAKFAYENPVPENQGLKGIFGFHRNLPGDF